MEEAEPILEFLPASFSNRSEGDYIHFLWGSFVANYENEKYEFANLAFHLLYMSFICFSVWQIRAARSVDFEKAMVGFQSDIENKLANAQTPFNFFDNLKESAIFRFIKLIGCNNQQVGEMAKFVKQRNRIAHPSGTMFFNDQQALDDHVAQVLTQMAILQSHMTPVLHDILRDFLLNSFDQETREWADDKTEIEANLLHKHYFSQKDIEACSGFDIGFLSGERNYTAIKALFDTFVDEYKQDE